MTSCIFEQKLQNVIEPPSYVHILEKSFVINVHKLNLIIRGMNLAF